MIEFSYVRPNVSYILSERLPADVNRRIIGYARTKVVLSKKYQDVKNDIYGVLENFINIICFVTNINIAKIMGCCPQSQEMAIAHLSLLSPFWQTMINSDSIHFVPILTIKICWWCTTIDSIYTNNVPFLLMPIKTK